MAKVAEALIAHKVKYVEIRGSNSQRSGALAKFQDDGAIEKVLLLNVGDESASGACVYSIPMFSNDWPDML